MGNISFKASKPKTEEYPKFTNFTIKVDAEGSWAKTVRKLQNNVKGVINFRFNKDGNVNISGYIDPNLFLKHLEKAGKSAQMVDWQYGECSSNLFVKKEAPSIDKGKGYYLYPGYEGYNGYGYPPNYGRRNYPFNHLECAGNASDCSGHHIQKPPTPDKSSSSSSSKSQFQKLASRVNDPKCCSLM